MVDFGWAELLVVAVIALIVIGPRDLPRALYTLGKWARKIRRIGQSFQQQIDDVVEDAELKDVKEGVESARKGDLKHKAERYVREQADPEGEVDAAARSLSGQAEDVDRETVNANAAAQKARESGETPAEPEPEPATATTEPRS